MKLQSGSPKPHASSRHDTIAPLGIQPDVAVIPDDGPDLADDESPRHRHNFSVISWYQILLRVGWIFKTESVIVPAALDSLGASGLVRGFLPVLGRFGQSVPPLLAWPSVKRAERLGPWLVASTITMAGSFAMLAAVWIGGFHVYWEGATQWIFLGLYAVFFCAVGLNQLVLSTLIGKLVLVRRRGLLMLMSSTRGAAISIVGAWILLGQWLHESTAEFAAIFGVAAGCFLVASLISTFLKEPPEPSAAASGRFRKREIFLGVWQIWMHDRRYRHVAVISGLFGMSMTLFPHYQTLARVQLGAGFADLLPWLIAQNAGVAVFSVPAGWVADRLGNRLVLRIVLIFLAIVPVLAVYFSQQPAFGRSGFTALFFLLGLTPVTMRVLSNFSLEFAEPAEHARYLTAQTFAMALPVVLTSVLFGWTFDYLGPDVVFGMVAGCLLIAWLLTFFLEEPRHGSQNS